MTLAKCAAAAGIFALALMPMLIQMPLEAETPPPPQQQTQHVPSSLSFGRIVPPRHDPIDAGLQAFLGELRAVVNRRDAKRFLELVITDIGTESGSPSGRAAFATYWHLDDPKSEFWHDMEWLLSLEGHETPGRGYTLPYAARTFPRDKLDAIEDIYGAIVRPRATLRAEPSTSGRTITELSYDIVKLDTSRENAYDENPDKYGDHGAPWIKVELGDGRRGYVAREDYWSALDLYLAIAFIDGRWQITAVAGGD